MSGDLHLDGLPRLSAAALAAALRHLGVEHRPPEETTLFALQRAWLEASPFHNLDLLAGVEGLGPPTSAFQAVAAALSWRGGPCHVQAAGFATLLRALGFDARLVPATVGEPDDHLVVGVVIRSRRWLCDVGNGHPYPQPFPWESAWSGERFGWSFRTSPHEGGLVLERKLADGRWKRVYRVRWEERRYEDFARIITAHHSRPGFGPFLTGLRAVRTTRHVMLTLRDGVYERHTAFGSWARPVRDQASAMRLLRGPFDLGGTPMDAAISSLRSHRTDLLDSPAVSPPARILVSLATMDRPEGLARLLRSLHAVAAEDPAVEVLVLENSLSDASRIANVDAVASAAQLGLRIELVDDGRYGRSIAASRDQQTHIIAQRVATGHRPELVWMIDDDLVFSSLTFEDGSLVERELVGVLAALRRARDAHPELSAIVGCVSGDPPIRPEATLRTQLLDAVENLQWFAERDPEAPYVCPDVAPLYALPDYYYDHSRAGTSHLRRTCPWMPRVANETVRQALLAYLRALADVPHGHQATRAVLPPRGDEVSIGAPTATVLRGGNAIFFDVDAALSHPYPVADLGDLESRRADMIGATLLARSPGIRIATTTLALLHVRSPSAGAEPPDAQARWRGLRAELCGVLLARVGIDPIPTTNLRAHVAELARERAETITDALHEAWHMLQRLDAMVIESPAWWARDAEIVAALDSACATLRAMWGTIVGGDDASAPSRRLADLSNRLFDERDLDAVLTVADGLPHVVGVAHDRRAAAHDEMCR